jgi:hypothetical protein
MTCPVTGLAVVVGRIGARHRIQRDAVARRHVGELFARHFPFFRRDRVIDDDPRDLRAVVKRLAQMLFELRTQHEKKTASDQREDKQRDGREHESQTPGDRSIHDVPASSRTSST